MRKNLFLFCAFGTFALLAIPACEKSEDYSVIEESTPVETVYAKDIWNSIDGKYSGNFTSSEIRKIDVSVSKCGERSISVDFGQVKLKNGLPMTNLKFDSVFAKKHEDGTYSFFGETIVSIDDYIVPGTIFEFEADFTGYSDVEGRLIFEISSPNLNLSASFIGSK